MLSILRQWVFSECRFRLWVRWCLVLVWLVVVLFFLSSMVQCESSCSVVVWVVSLDGFGQEFGVGDVGEGIVVFRFGYSVSILVQILVGWVRICVLSIFNWVICFVFGQFGFFWDVDMLLCQEMCLYEKVIFFMLWGVEIFFFVGEVCVRFVFMIVLFIIVEICERYLYFFEIKGYLCLFLYFIIVFDFIMFFMVVGMQFFKENFMGVFVVFDG